MSSAHDPCTCGAASRRAARLGLSWRQDAHAGSASATDALRAALLPVLGVLWLWLTPTAADATPRVLTAITSVPATESTSSSSTASFPFTTNWSNATFRCSLNAASYAACFSPVFSSNLAHGSHALGHGNLQPKCRGLPRRPKRPKGCPHCRRRGSDDCKIFPPGSKSIYWGALIGDQFTGSQPPWDWSAVTAFERVNSGGKRLSVLHFGSQWYSPTHCRGYCSLPSSLFSRIRRAGVIPFFSWGSTSESGRSGFTNGQIAAGSQDAYITRWARAAKAWGHPFFLRFDWEMNGNWLPFGVGYDGNTADDYVAMWRRVHDIFSRVGAINANWTWCPNVDPGNTGAPLKSLYPGDAYVDWTCLDGYNGNNPWRSFDDLFMSTYKKITGRIAPTKPMIIGETGATETGGSKAKWITNMLRSLPVNFRKIRGVLWYNRGGVGPGGYSDWPIESSRTSSVAFATAIRSPIFTTKPYSNLTANGATPPPE
jgi:Glycosyl hydrolase family 26